MSYQRERERFLMTIHTPDGLTLDAARLCLRHATTLQRIAELSCSSEAADRDRVPCPGAKAKTPPDTCLCRDYGSHGDNPCQHGLVPRINVQGAQIEARLAAICAPFGIKAVVGEGVRLLRVLRALGAGWPRENLGEWHRGGCGMNPADGSGS